MKASAYVINNKRDVQLPDTTVQTSSSGVHTIPMSTQGRHAVLLTLQSALNNAPSTSMRHFDVPDTLYGAVQPDTRGSAVGRVGGGYPIPVGTIKAGCASAPMKREGSGHHGKGHNDKNKPQPPKWPITMSRSTLPPDRGVAEMSTSLEGKLDNIASDVLSVRPFPYSRLLNYSHAFAAECAQTHHAPRAPSRIDEGEWHPRVLRARLLSTVVVWAFEGRRQV